MHATTRIEGQTATATFSKVPFWCTDCGTGYRGTVVVGLELDARGAVIALDVDAVEDIRGAHFCDCGDMESPVRCVERTVDHAALLAAACAAVEAVTLLSVAA
jgi:hypothetical protein